MSLGAIFSGFNGPGHATVPMTVLRAPASVPHHPMSDKSGKAKKTRKSAKAQPSVLGSLPSTRPDRLGRRGPAATPKRTPAKRAAAPRPKPAKVTKAAKPKAAAAPKPAPPPPSPPPPRERRPASPPSGPQLVTTAIQAAGEIAQFGLSVGGRALRRAAGRIPRP
jgi:hypothetical protein